MAQHIVPVPGTLPDRWTAGGGRSEKENPILVRFYAISGTMSSTTVYLYEYLGHSFVIALLTTISTYIS
jgi:hypothetical protein